MAIFCEVAIVLATLLGNHASVSAPRTEYLVEVRDTSAHSFHVTAVFSGLDQQWLDVSLPTWMPGHYAIEGYAKNVRRLTATNTSGQPVGISSVGSSAWRINASRQTQIKIEFDYRADVRAPQEANVSDTYAFFTGVQLFLLAEGRRNSPSTVRFSVPRGWRIASALSETSDSLVFAASDYDELVDAPTWLGAFESRRFEVEGKPHYLVWEVPGRFRAVSEDTISAVVSRMSSVIRTQRAIFGTLPYDKYIVFMTPGPSPTSPGAIEHRNSFVGVHYGDLGNAVNPHEFFHVWNVKRIRPAELWPYDYSRPNVTPSLWFAEGVTSYYDVLTRYRVGFTDAPTMLETLGSTIGRVEAAGARRFVSPSEASTSVWLGPSHYSFWSYYPQGEVLGALLDVSILHDTQGRRGLDDVMRRLYRDFYQKNRGFTPNEMIETISSVAGRDYHDFFRRYVTGVETPPYDSIFAKAGVNVRQRYLGIILAPQTVVTQGRRLDSIVANGPAAVAGLRRGDVIVQVDGTPVNRERNWCCRFVDGEGERSVLNIRRDGNTIEQPIVLGRGPQTIQLELAEKADPSQLRIRNAWLARPVERRQP